MDRRGGDSALASPIDEKTQSTLRSFGRPRVHRPVSVRVCERSPGEERRGMAQGVHGRHQRRARSGTREGCHEPRADRAEQSDARLERVRRRSARPDGVAGRRHFVLSRQDRSALRHRHARHLGHGSAGVARRVRGAWLRSRRPADAAPPDPGPDPDRDGDRVRGILGRGRTAFQARRRQRDHGCDGGSDSPRQYRGVVSRVV